MSRATTEAETDARVKLVTAHAEASTDPIPSMLRRANEHLDRSPPDVLGAKVFLHGARLAVSHEALSAPPVGEAQPVAWTNAENLAAIRRGKGAATMWPNSHGQHSIPLYALAQPGSDGLREVIAKRRAIYEAKRDRHSILDDECLTFWEMYDFAVEVCSYFESDMEALASVKEGSR